MKREVRRGTYFEQPDQQSDRLRLHVHFQALVEPVPDFPHVLVVARLPKHPLCGRPPFPQQHKHLLAKGIETVSTLPCGWEWHFKTKHPITCAWVICRVD